PSSAGPPTSWPTSTTPAPPTGPPRPSTDDWSTYAARPSASATSPTTSPDRSSRPAASGRGYTLDCEEPVSGCLRGVSGTCTGRVPPKLRRVIGRLPVLLIRRHSARLVAWNDEIQAEAAQTLPPPSPDRCRPAQHRPLSRVRRSRITQ